MDAKTRGEIEKQARLYEAALNGIMERIKNKVKMAKEELELAERELLEEVEIELGENPFTKVLAEIESGNPPTDAEVRNVLEKGVPQDFGPSKESFCSLLKEIEAFKSWRVKEEKPSVAAPSNVRVEGTTQDSITLAWNDDWRAISYQIEMDGSGPLDRVLTNKFTMSGLLLDTEHTFRVRTVRGDSASEWSDVVKGRTQRAPEFKKCCVWKKCPGNVHKYRKYSVDEKNTRIATKIDIGDSNFHCTIIGNTPLPHNTVTSWSIKVLKSKGNDGGGIIIGVAPSGINQNDDNYVKCGWYFACYGSVLYSGPPHKYGVKEYGPRKGNGQYVHTGDSVGVVMDTAKGELSFVVNGVNLGVAYEGIPLDKPLVPCALLLCEGDSVELVI